MTSLRRNHSDHPASVSPTYVAKHILRRNSSGRRDGIILTSAPLRRNSSGKGDRSTAPRVASMLKRMTSNSGDTATSDSPSVKSFPDSSQSQNASHSSLVYRPHLFSSTNSDHTSMLENVVNSSGGINLSHKSSFLDNPKEVSFSSSNEVIDEHAKSIFLESNNVIKEIPKSIPLESNEERDEPLKSIHLESNKKIEEPPDSLDSNEEIEEPSTSIHLNPPVPKPRKLAAVTGNPPPFSTFQPPSPLQSCPPPSPPTLRKSAEEANDFTEESTKEPSSLAYKVWFSKTHFYVFLVYLL